MSNIFTCFGPSRSLLARGQPPPSLTAFHMQLPITWGGSRKIQEGCICCKSDWLRHLWRWRRWRPNYWERPDQRISWGDGEMATRNTCEFKVDVLCQFMWNMYAICWASLKGNLNNLDLALKFKVDMHICRGNFLATVRTVIWYTTINRFLAPHSQPLSCFREVLINH